MPQHGTIKIFPLFPVMKTPQQIIDSFTSEERAYFIACTDIFHDSSYSVTGRPSSSNQLQNTVVINLERTISVSDFPALDPNATWDCNIVSLPFLTTQRMISSVDTGYAVQLPAATSSQDWGGVTAFGAATGGQTILPYTQNLTVNANRFFYPEWTATLTDDIPRPYYEILSIGMEVINSTPDLYRGGNVVRYRVPTQGRKSALLIGDPAISTALARSEFMCYPMPPISESFATQYSDSVIDKAENGSYQMHTLQDQVSDFFLAGNSRVFFSNPAPAPAGSGGFNTWTSQSAFNNDYSTDPPLIRGDFDIVGSYFTGLSPQTTLKIRSRSIVSLVPSSTNASLTSLAKLTPPPNQRLDKLIADIQSSFSPGIESSMNASGDWWRVVLRGVAKVAKPVGNALGGEVGETIGGGVAAVANSLSKVNQKKNKNNKKSPKATPATKPGPTQP